MAGSDGRTRAILVVEDDPQPRVMFHLLLEGEGHLVVTAGDGPGAVRRAGAARPVLVLLDVDLPFLDGGASPPSRVLPAVMGCRSSS